MTTPTSRRPPVAPGPAPATPALRLNAQSSCPRGMSGAGKSAASTTQRQPRRMRRSHTHLHVPNRDADVREPLQAHALHHARRCAPLDLGGLHPSQRPAGFSAAEFGAQLVGRGALRDALYGGAQSRTSLLGVIPSSLGPQGHRLATAPCTWLAQSGGQRDACACDLRDAAERVRDSRRPLRRRGLWSRLQCPRSQSKMVVHPAPSL